jgi:hypothetical protein
VAGVGSGHEIAPDPEPDPVPAESVTARVGLLPVLFGTTPISVVLDLVAILALLTPSDTK